MVLADERFAGALSPGLPPRLRLGAAAPAGPRPTEDVGVRVVVGMSSVAPRLGEGGSPVVLCHGHRLQVLGVHAAGDAAQMVEHQPVRYGADQEFVGDPVGLSVPSIEVELAVAPDTASRPDPASLGLGHPGPESLHGGGEWGQVSVLPSTLVAGSAESTRAYVGPRAPNASHVEMLLGRGSGVRL